MNILITGAAGFIGYHLVRQFAGHGHTITGLDSLNGYYDVRLKEGRLSETGIDPRQIDGGRYVRSTSVTGYQFVRADITDRVAMERIFDEGSFDVVCHMAAQAGVRYSLEAPFSYTEANVTGFLSILECCRKHNIRHLVYASSSSVYGANAKIPFSEEDRTDSPVSLYAATKKANEVMAAAYSSLYGLRTTGLRFFTVYGPWGRPDMAPMIFADAICRGKEIDVFNNGDMMRDFTYIDDITQGVGRIALTQSGGPLSEIYNIGCSSPVKLMEFISLMERAIGKKALLRMMPMQKGDVVRTYASTEKLERDYGYKPSVGLGEGVGKFIDWYLSADNPLR